ncbi:MAG: flavodoxin domain-containing protein [Bacillota bacterium]|nr:flavodoxin domain-containing protein [Bacillota bacterium]
MKSIIIYSTKYGTVEKAAKILKSKISHETEIINVAKDKIPALDDYDNIILGGSIYAGRTQKELIEFSNQNLQQLLKKKIGLFICGAQSEKESIEKELKDAFSLELYNHAIFKDSFGSEINFEKLNFMEKIILRIVKGDKSSYSDIHENKIEELVKVMKL